MDQREPSAAAESSCQPKTTDSKVVVVVGMHRSGTSLTANWLARCGLDVGDDLMMGRPDNPAGHYEDRTFVQLHVDMLKDNDLGYLVTPGQRLCIHPDRQRRAREIIRAKPPGIVWGWKDPRTALFLRFWKSLIPEMKVLAVYRSYPEVVLSLLRRDYLRWQRPHRRLARSPFHRLAVPVHAAIHVARTRLYLKVWERYNQDLLAFARSNPDDVMIVRIDDVVSRSVSLLSSINDRWDVALELLDAHTVMEPELIHHAPSRWKQGYMSRLQPSVVETWRQLERSRCATLSAMADRRKGR